MRLVPAPLPYTRPSACSTRKCLVRGNWSQRSRNGGVNAVSVKRTSGFGGRDGLLARGLLQLGNLSLDLGPHVLERLGSAAGHVNFVPLDALPAALELGDDSKKKLKLRGRAGGWLAVHVPEWCVLACGWGM